MDENKRNISAKRIIAIVVIALFISGVGLPLLEQANAGTSGDRGDIISPLIPGEDQLVLTPEETAYIATSPIIKAASVDGVAPLSFTDAQGEAKGIFRSVVEQISAMSGMSSSLSYMIPLKKLLTGGYYLRHFPQLCATICYCHLHL